MIDWNYIVMIAGILLLLFLLGSEVLRKNKARLIWRLVATIGSVVSLVCMALPITYHRVATVSPNQNAVLLTDGFNPDSVRSFLKENKGIRIFFEDKDLKDADKYNALYVDDLSNLGRQKDDINRLHVFGYGLQKNELKALQNLPVVFHPTEIANGITEINWQKTLKADEKVVLTGSINNELKGPVKVVLNSFHTTLDSVIISTGKNKTFQLSATPKNVGRALFSIAVINQKDTIERELIPVQIEQGRPLKVLMLQSSPNFDNKFLKNWLAQKGYVVAAKTTISKNKFEKDFLNTEAVSLDKITASLLDKYDVTIADAAALRSLSPAEFATINAAIAEKAMGLIVTIDSAVSGKSSYANSFYTAADSLQQLNLHLLDFSVKFPALAIETPLFIRDRTDAKNLVFDAKNHVLANSTLRGLGKVVITTLTNTFSWSLAGSQSDYETFWSTLLNNCSPKATQNETWATAPIMPEVNRQVEVQVRTNSVAKPQGQIGEAAVYLAQNAVLPYQFSGSYYPTKDGWQAGIQLDGKPFYWYVYSKSDWKSLRAQETIKATKQFALASKPLKERSPSRIEETKSEVSKMIFFVLFLLFSGFLWLENKF